ncbi:hypothetical protein L6164_027164 [Bauhinia variegata]|uniref:Uncharacterized protein n=1 Tax=Bauhinia variegata TaxID=167791 RepID=A0ACB9LSJ8_BAUVA|nr:hypothetical protein L6164_027164 [Bauhinia variegata]
MAWPSFPFRSSTVAPKQCDLFVSFRDVRHQKGSYEKALAKHEQFHGRHTKEKLHGWRNALTKAANLRGFNSLEYRKEADLVEKIAEEVFLNLQNVQLAYEGMLQGEPLPRDEETSQEVLKRSLGKVVKVIKKHANASVSWNFRKGKAPSVDGNVECHF